MKQQARYGARHALASAIVVALAGSAAAADPSLRVLTPITGGALERIIDLNAVEYRPGSKLLVAQSIAGNFDCGAVDAPATGAMQLELDGKRYAVALPTGSPPVSYAPSTAQFSLSLEQVTSTDCASTGLTMFDFVMMGPDGRVTARSRVAQAVQVYLPGASANYPIAVLHLADPIHCESYGLDDPGLAGDLTYPNGTNVPLYGLERLEYRLQTDINGRRELRHHAKVSTDGVQMVQCTSPGLLMGTLGGGGAAPEILFVSGFERREGQADVVLALASNSLITGDGTAALLDKVGFEGSDGVHMTMTLRNAGRSEANGVRVREYLRNGQGTEMKVVAGSTPGTTCAPLPGTTPDPCVGLDLAFPLSFDIAQLPAGHGIELQMHRQLEDAVVGEEIKVGYAAFVNPAPAGASAADATLGNNTHWVNFAVS